MPDAIKGKDILFDLIITVNMLIRALTLWQIDQSALLPK